MISECKIDIFCSGITENIEKDIKENKNIQKVNERKPNCIIGTTVELPVQETKTVQESMQVSQGKLVISLDVDSKIENLSYVASVYNAILGGGANSRLFKMLGKRKSGIHCRFKLLKTQKYDIY